MKLPTSLPRPQSFQPTNGSTHDSFEGFGASDGGSSAAYGPSSICKLFAATSSDHMKAD